MKNIFSIILLISIINFSACTTEENQSADKVIFKAKINGELFEATKISQATLLHIGNQGQRFDITVENDKYKFNFAIAVDQISDCMPTGDYVNDFNGREMLLITSFANGNNFLSVHFPVEDSNGITEEIATVTNCVDTKISGTFSGTYYYENDPTDPLDIPEDLVITDGVFQNIEFTILNP